MKEILKEWNLDVNPNQIYHTTWSIKDTYVLKEYTDLNTLQKNIQMHKILHESGIPVPEICPLSDGREYCCKNDKMYVLFTKLKGSNIVNHEQMDESWYFEFGRILAKLHIAFQKCEKDISFWNNSLLEEMQGWVKQNLDKYAPGYVSTNEIEAAISQLSQVYGELPRQLIHRDVHLGNFLFEGKQFSGYIDFDLSQRNIRIFDICYFLLGLLNKEDSNRIDEESWFRNVRQVMEGYDSLIKLKDVEKLSVACVMKNIELLFIAYFLSVGDEKSAKDSAELFHYVNKNETRIQSVVSISDC